MLGQQVNTSHFCSLLGGRVMSCPFYTQQAITSSVPLPQASCNGKHHVAAATGARACPFHPVLAPPCLESSHGHILITWQSHSRRLHRFPLRPRPAPQTALLLPHRPNFTLGAKKKKPPTSRQTFVNPRELCPLPPQPWHRQDMAGAGDACSFHAFGCFLPL